MFCKGFLKRSVPFILTLTIGMFIASFFVSIAVPTFENKRGRHKHRQYHQQLEMENNRLKLENNRIRKQLADFKNQDDSAEIFELRQLNLDVPPPPPITRTKEERGK